VRKEVLMKESILQALAWRYAAQVFDPTKKVSKADLGLILESARLAPSSIGIEAWKFIVVENPEIRMQLREAGYGQSKISDASHLIVLARRTDIRENIANERIERTALAQSKNGEELAGLRQMLEGGIARKDDETLAAWAAAQTYIPLGMMTVAASLLGVDNAPMEGFDNATVDAILGLSAQNLASVSMIALGYRSESDPYATLAKVRRPFEEVVHFVR
jgi:nitroreductase/dihydropteridine reductase